MVKDHSDNESGNPLTPHGLLFLISKQGFFYMHHPTDRITHKTAFVIPVLEHWLEQEIAQWGQEQGPKQPNDVNTRLTCGYSEIDSYHRVTEVFC